MVQKRAEVFHTKTIAKYFDSGKAVGERSLKNYIMLYCQLSTQDYERTYIEKVSCHDNYNKQPKVGSTELGTLPAML